MVSFFLRQFSLVLGVISLLGCSGGDSGESTDSSFEPIANYHSGSFKLGLGNDKPYTSITITLAENLPEDVMRDMSFVIEVHASEIPNEGYGFAFYYNVNKDDCGGYGTICMRSLFNGRPSAVVMRDYEWGISNLTGVSKFQFTEDRLEYNWRESYKRLSAGNVNFSVEAYLNNSNGKTISQDFAPTAIGFFDSFGIFDDPLRDYAGNNTRADILSVEFEFDPDGGP